MFKSVFLKYVTAFMLINICCMFILTSIITSLVNTYNTSAKTRTLSSAAIYVSEYLDKGFTDSSIGDFDYYVNVYAPSIRSLLNMMSINVDELILFVCDKDGNIILSGGSPSAEKFGGADGKFGKDETTYKLSESLVTEIKESNGINKTTNLENIFDEDYIMYACPIYAKNDEFAGIVLANTVNSGMNSLLNAMTKTIIMSTLWIMLAVLVAVYFISEKLVSPLRAMSKAAKQFAAGQFDVRVPVHGNDEVAELAKAFNNMAGSLASNEEMRRLFLANVSHDLRTPMTTISGFIDGILDGAIPKEKHEYYLGVVATEVRRLSRLVSTLLDITKIQAGERKFNMESFDICEMCRQIVISSEQRIEEKKLEVEFKCDNDNMFVTADTDAIYQILYNLVDNAIKFSYEESRFIIDIHEHLSKIEISVFNEGVGISPEDIPHVFDRFYKSDKSRGLDKTGVGLGLYIARTIVEAHGEKITVESEHGSWCRFTFTLAKGQPVKKLPPKNK